MLSFEEFLNFNTNACADTQLIQKREAILQSHAFYKKKINPNQTNSTELDRANSSSSAVSAVSTVSVKSSISNASNSKASNNINNYYLNKKINKKYIINESINRPVNAILNKLTKDNYNRLYKDVINLSQLLDINVIIDNIIKYSGQQIQYNKLPIQLFTDINNARDIKPYITEHINDNLFNKNWYDIKKQMILSINNDITNTDINTNHEHDNDNSISTRDESIEYNNYCDVNKIKKTIINTTFTYLDLINDLKLDIDKDDLLSYSLNLYDKIYNNSDSKELLNNKITVYLEYLFYLTRIHKSYIILNEYNLLYDTLHNKIKNEYSNKYINSKNKFLMVDIMEFLEK